MFMDPPITHPLTILIRQSTRTSECQLVPYTGSIAGHICVLAGGGEDAVVVSSLALSENFRCRLSENYRRIAIVLAPLLAGSLFWASYRNRGSSADPAKPVTAARSSTSSSMSQETAHIDSSDSEGLGNAQSAIMFSIAPLTSLSAMTPLVDPDPIASFRDLVAGPPDTAREAPHIDARRMRTLVDRGVVEYASAKTDGDRAKGAGLIQTAALVGYPPARALLARNYPQSEAVRSVVPAKDVIRYALGPVMDAAATGEDAKEILLALGQHFALHGQVDLFATQILISLRGDSRPQLGYRIDTLLDLLVTRLAVAIRTQAMKAVRARPCCDRHDGAAEGGDVPDRCQAAQPGARVAGTTGEEARR